MMFTDHGEYLGDYDMVEKWPAGVHGVLTRNPLMIAGPDLPRGQVTEALCEMVDLVPTVLELLGVEERYPHSGVSLVKTIQGEHQSHPAELTHAETLSEHKPYAFSEGGFLLREEPLTERGSFPYDKKSSIQHTWPSSVGRAVSDSASMVLIADQPRSLSGTRIGRTLIVCTRSPNFTAASMIVSEKYGDSFSDPCSRGGAQPGCSAGARRNLSATAGGNSAVDGGNVGLCTVEAGCALPRGRFGISQIADCQEASQGYNQLKLFEMTTMHHMTQPGATPGLADSPIVSRGI